MSIVTPLEQGTIIKLYKNVPWDNNYKDIMLFESQSSQISTMASYAVHTWSQCSIVKGTQTIKLEGNVNDYLTCNYLSFQNNSLTGATRVYYCFINSIDYINVNTFAVTYEIDWIQSFLFDLEIESCFVEREHVNDDIMGRYTLDEMLDTGEYIATKVTEWKETPGVYAYVMLEESNAMSMKNGVASGLNTVAATIANISNINAWLETYNDTPEKIVKIGMCTAGMVNSGGYISQKSFSKINSTSVTFQGQNYTFQNAKCNCFPYQFISVDNYCGNVEQYRFEDFNSPSSGMTLNFMLKGSLIPQPCLEIYPQNYKLQDDAKQFKMIYDRFPECPWKNDSFSKWVTETGIANVTTLGAMVGNAILSPVSSNQQIVGGALNLVSGVANFYQDYKNHVIHSAQLQGQIGNSGMNYYDGDIGFRATQYCIKPEYMKKIDKFFTRYGYKVNLVKIPNTTGRAVVNYVKTSYSHVSGNVPNDTKSTLEKALDSGVSFWHSISLIGSDVEVNAIV